MNMFILHRQFLLQGEVVMSWLMIWLVVMMLEGSLLTCDYLLQA
jgi:hypothetical protein